MSRCVRDWSAGDGARRQLRATVAVITLASLTAAGCAESSGSYGDFQSKVHQSAKDAQSAVATAQLMAEQVLRGRSTLAYADTVVSNAEDDVGSIQTAFDTRQPPDVASIKLRDKFDGVLQNAITAAEDLRIAVRRNDSSGIRQALDEASKAVKQLQGYAR